jgi:hypothetical protein
MLYCEERLNKQCGWKTNVLRNVHDSAEIIPVKLIWKHMKRHIYKFPSSIYQNNLVEKIFLNIYVCSWNSQESGINSKCHTNLENVTNIYHMEMVIYCQGFSWLLNTVFLKVTMKTKSFECVSGITMLKVFKVATG